jgi:hypothetical protein
LYRLEKRFERRSRGVVSVDQLLPIERAYVEAMNLAWLDPERGLAKLQALVDLHVDRTDPTGPDGQCLDLARRQVQRLRQQVDRFGPESQEDLENRLKRAEELRESDPETARTILRGLVEFYQDKPSAAEIVAKARQALDEQIRSAKSEIRNKSP